jgi:transcriptional regulator with XRE-family HTH domain
MTITSAAFAEPSGRYPIFRPPCEFERVSPSADASEEVALTVAGGCCELAHLATVFNFADMALGKFAPNAALRHYRLARGLTQAQLSQATDGRVSQPVIAKLELGGAQTTARLATLLAAPLGLQPRDLFPSDAMQPTDLSQVDARIMRRAIAVGRRLTGNANEDLAAEITVLAYELLLGEQQGHPISDNERTLVILDRFFRHLTARLAGPPPETG